MSNQTIERLRALGTPIGFQAADEIERLTAALNLLCSAAQGQAEATKVESVSLGATRRRARTLLDELGPVAPASQFCAQGDIVGCLEHMVQHGTESGNDAVVLMYDKEDGFWISSVDCGCHHHPVKDLTGSRRASLTEAVIAAAQWHNEQGEKSYMSYVKKCSLPALTG